MKIPIKLNKEKMERFNTLVAQLIEEGFDLGLNNQQQTATLYLNNTSSMYSLNLHSNGTWTLE
jgi:hypothetical protein